ncbi:glycosyltransferase [Cellulomonas timonensis]|uniref:glycosyltransferase n=1 Tax=Cellulomonas timonensis TaxID=1689271 RepID=UPI000B0F4228|nr:glycosyltransferase [Cellulomonas timonensis]
MEDPRVTVVVMSRDRRDELLGSLPRHAAPVVLVDNGSTDGTAPEVRRRLPHVSVVELAANHGALARDIGVEPARTPFVAFADDDSWWEPGALHEAAELLAAHPRTAVVAARVLVGVPGLEDPMNSVLAGSPLRLAGAPGPRVLGFVACAAMVRRDAFLSVGGFDPLVRFPGEEEPVALRLAAAGWEVFTPTRSSSTITRHRPGPTQPRAPPTSRGPP